MADFPERIEIEDAYGEPAGTFRVFDGSKGGIMMIGPRREYALLPDDMQDFSDGFHTFKELYHHRELLFLSMMLAHPAISWASKTHNPPEQPMYEGFFVAGMNLPEGQISYHLSIELWHVVENAGISRNRQPKWDGHTSQDVLIRLASWVFNRMDADG